MERVETRRGIAPETARGRERDAAALTALAAGSLLAAACAGSLLAAACARGCRPEGAAACAALEDNIRRGVYGDELCGFPGKEDEEWRRR